VVGATKDGVEELKQEEQVNDIKIEEVVEELEELEYNRNVTKSKEDAFSPARFLNATENDASDLESELAAERRFDVTINDIRLHQHHHNHRDNEPTPLLDLNEEKEV
jgi:hypothetical protein